MLLEHRVITLSVTLHLRLKRFLLSGKVNSIGNLIRFYWSEISKHSTFYNVCISYLIFLRITAQIYNFDTNGSPFRFRNCRKTGSFCLPHMVQNPDLLIFNNKKNPKNLLMWNVEAVTVLQSVYGHTLYIQTVQLLWLLHAFFFF